MTPLEEHERRIKLLEDASTNHSMRIRILEALTARVITLTDIVIQILQHQRDDDAANGR